MGIVDCGSVVARGHGGGMDEATTLVLALWLSRVCGGLCSMRESS